MVDMSEEEPSPPEYLRRCPNCDSVLTQDTVQCLMCGQFVGGSHDPEAAAALDADKAETNEIPHEELISIAGSGFSPTLDDFEANRLTDVGTVEAGQIDGTSESNQAEDAVENQALRASSAGSSTSNDQLAIETLPAFESMMVERQSRVTFWLTSAFLVITVFLAVLVLQYPASARIAFIPTATVMPPTVTRTPTWTPLPSDTRPPSDTPTSTPIPRPTDTPRPPRFHTVEAGETLFGLSLRFGVTAASIAEANNLLPESGIQVNQQLLVPWPTATPPLVAVAVEIGDETIIADPAGCEMYEIQGGDTLFGIAARSRVDLRALLAVNRLTDQTILQPGDAICIPAIIRGGVLPPTPGPSPTPTQTQPPPGPQLLYPGTDASIETGQMVLQWAAVKDLDENEWYMVEVTDLSEVDSHPLRGFTRQNAFRVPATWRPPEPEVHRFRWLVSIVLVTGQRDDGGFIYTFGGNRSEPDYFSWLGAIPAPTPTPTSTLVSGS